MNFVAPVRIKGFAIGQKDGEDLKLKKTLLLICSSVFVVIAMLWGFMYIGIGVIRSGLIPLLYAGFSMMSILYFLLTGRYKFFRFAQLILMLLLPFLLMVSLGGFVNGSAVILWSFVSPCGALVFDRTRNAKYWFVSFIILVIASWVLQPYMHSEAELTTSQIVFFFAMNTIGVGIMTYILISYFVQKKNVFQRQTESLLQNILPESIIPVLKSNHKAIAQHYDSSSIMFADIAGFTDMSAHMDPDELVEMLNNVFTEFDSFVEKYNMEKIKTIGDAYMVASGIPVPREDHAKQLVRMALELCRYVKDRNVLGHKLGFRIGINSGPVVAGVIGSKKFSYDLWGDTVNLASRLESSGEVGKVNISQYTYELVKDVPDFIFESRGKVKVKGRGEVEMYFVQCTSFKT